MQIMHYFTPWILDIWPIQVTSMTMAIVSIQDSCSTHLIHIYFKYLGSTIRSETWWEPCWRDYMQLIPRAENIYELQFNYKPHIRTGCSGSGFQWGMMRHWAWHVEIQSHKSHVGDISGPIRRQHNSSHMHIYQSKLRTRNHQEHYVERMILVQKKTLQTGPFHLNHYYS